MHPKLNCSRAADAPEKACEGSRPATFGLQICPSRPLFESGTIVEFGSGLKLPTHEAPQTQLQPRSGCARKSLQGALQRNQLGSSKSKV